MTTVCPIVISLNRRKSLDNRHGNSPFRPITPFSDTATIIDTCMDRSTAKAQVNAKQKTSQI
jgi:hypothetical protein